MDLSREAILGHVDLRVQAVEVPEWGGTVYLRELGGDDRDRVEIRSMQIKDNLESLRGYRAFVLSMTLCDAAGAPLFTPDDIAALGQKNAGVLDRLTEQVLDMSGLGLDAVDDAKKNSGPAPNGASGSNLR